MDECVGLTSNDALENDRNVGNRCQVSDRNHDDDSSTRRHSLSSTLVRQSVVGDSNFGSRRSIFRRSTKLTPNPSIITSNQSDETYQTANTGLFLSYFII
jgi:hypothetical protein